MINPRILRYADLWLKMGGFERNWPIPKVSYVTLNRELQKLKKSVRITRKVFYICDRIFVIYV